MYGTCPEHPQKLRLGTSQQAHFQQRQDLGSLRHHSDRHHSQDPVRAEQKIYDLVTKRFLAIFFPAAEYNITTRITRVEKEAFKTEGKVLVSADGSPCMARKS
jgi:DNA topoisomerase IA